MPVSVLKWNELCAAATLSDDWLSTGRAAFREQLGIASGAVGFVLLHGELLAGQLGVTVRAEEALLVERLALIGDAVGCNYLCAFCAAQGKFVFIAAAAVNFVVLRYEGSCADSMFARNTHKALLVPLSSLVLEFFGASSKYFTAAVTFLSKWRIIAVAAENFVILGAEGLVD